MVESPATTLATPLAPNNNDAPDAPIKPAADPELLVFNNEPITKGLFKAERHLVARAGKLARFRGLFLFIIQNMATSALVRAFTAILPGSVPLQGLAAAFTAVILARLSTGWTHIVISEPSPRTWAQRIPSFKTWKKVAGPTFVTTAAMEVAVSLPLYLSSTWGVNHRPDDHAFFAKKSTVIVLLTLVMTFLVILPAQVVLTRVQASRLPEEDESIVPFDRSFGGKVVPEIVGGSGTVGMLDAWKTFGFNSRLRLVKFMAKVFLMEFFVVLLWAVTTITVVLTVSDSEALRKVMSGAQRKINGFA